MLAFVIAVIISIEADFVQTKYVSMMSEPQISTGRMIYRAPDYLQWAYETPQTLVWEVNGNTSNVNPQIQRLLRMIIASIAGDETAYAKMQKESKKLFQSIDITMDEQTHVAKKVELVEKNGDTTIIEFNHVVTK